MRTFTRRPAVLLAATGIATCTVLYLCEPLRAQHAERDDHEHETHTAATPCCPGADKHDDHDPHDGAEGEHANEVDEHDEHDHAAHADHDEHESHAGHDHGADDGLIRLTPEQRVRYGITIAEAQRKHLAQALSLRGEIVFNEDRVAHLVPRAPGIAVRIAKTIGDTVAVDEVLAVLDSAELASAKLDFVAAATELGCCALELPRAQAIHTNVVALLELLESSPTVDDLGSTVTGEMGPHGSALISAYAEFALTRKAYDRERALRENKVSSEEDFLAAESAFKKARAQYWSARETAAFEVAQDRLKVEREQLLSQLHVETARQNLMMLGLTKPQVAALSTIDKPEATTGEAHVCDDPNCANCRHATKAESSPASVPASPGGTQIGWHEIRAPFAGVIVDKHLTLGEHVDEDTDIFTVVDTSSVWAELTVHARHIASIEEGASVVIRVEHSGTERKGTISSITRFVDRTTRSATARVVLNNADGTLIPGTFITAHLRHAQEGDDAIVVPREAVQTVEDSQIVFVERAEGFAMVPVTTGTGDREQIAIRSGLSEGDRYVTRGAFELKATVITSNMGAHAGHGH